jgi:competence CoiA-like predicted nuclease
MYITKSLDISIIMKEQAITKAVTESNKTIEDLAKFFMQGKALTSPCIRFLYTYKSPYKTHILLSPAIENNMAAVRTSEVEIKTLPIRVQY